MATVAILIGIYSYLIFGIGLIGKLYQPVIIVFSLGFWIIIGYFLKTKIKGRIKEVRGRLKDFRGKIKEICISKGNPSLFLILLILIQVVVNLIGALGPELGFDALWYHLTLPKIYLLNHEILFVPGNLLYYSAMPKLVEMLYTAALTFQGEIFAKLIHFSFGILSVLALFKLSRRYLSERISLTVALIFYTSLVVGWQSITAYVDLGRTFFEILTLDFFLRWWERQNNQDLIESAVMLGLAVCSKLLSLGSLFIYLILIVLRSREDLKKLLLLTFNFSLLTLFVPLPWFVFSFTHTRNPFYPVFSTILGFSLSLTQFNVVKLVSDFAEIFLHSDDPTLPILLIVLPLILIYFKKFSKSGKLILAYCFLAYFVWFFTPRTGGGRFILPYLPAFSLLVGFVIEITKEIFLKKMVFLFLVLLAFVNIGYRVLANWRFLPVILGKETKNAFLIKNLNYNFGDFYDIDGFFAENIDKNDLILIYGIHNLFYVNFPFIHESWVKPGIPVTHILIKGGELPEKFGEKRLIYFNKITNVNLYVSGEKTK